MQNDIPAEPSNLVTTPQQNHQPIPQRKSTLSLILGGLALLTLGLGSGYFLGTHRPQATVGEDVVTTPTSMPELEESSVTDVTNTQQAHFYSNSKLSFAYPTNWQVTDKTEQGLGLIYISENEDDLRIDIQNEAEFGGSHTTDYQKRVENYIDYQVSSTAELGDMDPTIVNRESIQKQNYKGTVYSIDLGQPHPGMPAHVKWYVLTDGDTVAVIKNNSVLSIDDLLYSLIFN